MLSPVTKNDRRLSKCLALQDSEELDRAAIHTLHEALLAFSCFQHGVSRAGSVTG